MNANNSKNGTLRDFAMQRRDKKTNMCLPILALDAVLNAFNDSNFDGNGEKYYSLGGVKDSMEVQVEILNWLHEQLSDIPVEIPIISPFMDLNVLAQSVAWANNCGDVINISTTGESTVTHFMTEEEIISNSFKFPIPDKDRLMSQQAKFCHIAKTHGYLKEKMFMGYIPGPATLLGQIMGMKKMLKLFALSGRDSFKLKCLQEGIDTTNKVTMLFADYLMKNGFGAICILEPTALYHDNKRFNKFIFGPLSHLIANIKEQGGAVIFHACGDTTKLLRSFARLKGVDAFNLDEEVSLKYIAGWAKDAVVIGNSNNKIMGFDEANVIYRNACLMQLKNRSIEVEGRYIPGPGCEITFLDENPKNVLRKLKALLMGYDPNVASVTIENIDESFSNVS